MRIRELEVTRQGLYRVRRRVVVRALGRGYYRFGIGGLTRRRVRLRRALLYLLRRDLC